MMIFDGRLLFLTDTIFASVFKNVFLNDFFQVES